MAASAAEIIDSETAKLTNGWLDDDDDNPFASDEENQEEHETVMDDE